MKIKDPKTIIRNLFEKSLTKEDNIIFVDKLFIINTIVNYLFKDKSYQEIDQFQIARYGEIIHKYLEGEVDIYWEDGILMVQDLNNGERFAGG